MLASVWWSGSDRTGMEIAISEEKLPVTCILDQFVFFPDYPFALEIIEKLRI